MYNRSLLLELFLEIEAAIRRIERRFTNITLAHEITPKSVTHGSISPLTLATSHQPSAPLQLA